MEALQVIKNQVQKNPDRNFNYYGSKLNQVSGKPWTMKWIRKHFHYDGPIADEQRIIGSEAITEYKLYHQVLQFAKEREPYHYNIIAHNTRDLGGYQTKDGRIVKAGLLIRSNNLHNLTKRGAKFLYHHNINNVIDLRTQAEADMALDPNEMMPDGVRYFTGADLRAIVHWFPVFTNKGADISRPNTLRYGVIYRYGKTLVTEPQAKKTYYKSIKLILANHHNGTLYHCVEGRDRTGILSILLLSALNVPKATIYKDYLLTDYYAHTKPYVRQFSQINRFYQVIESKYGSVINYLHAIGITDKDIQELRKNYLK